MLKFRYRMKPRRMSNSSGLESGQKGRMDRLRKVVTKLFRYERYEGTLGNCDEARGYAELLIQRAVQHGDKHPQTMKMADHWLLEKDLVHKLFKVFVPRYQTYTTCVTNLWNLPIKYPGPGYPLAVVELKGNPWPPVIPKPRDTSNLLSNILLHEAKLDYHAQKERMLNNVLLQSLTSVAEDTTHETIAETNTASEIGGLHTGVGMTDQLTRDPSISGCVNDITDQVINDSLSVNDSSVSEGVNDVSEKAENCDEKLTEARETLESLTIDNQPSRDLDSKIENEGNLNEKIDSAPDTKTP